MYLRPGSHTTIEGNGTYHRVLGVILLANHPRLAGVGPTAIWSTAYGLSPLATTDSLNNRNGNKFSPKKTTTSGGYRDLGNQHLIRLAGG
jgi:hypothetical protein